MGRTLLACALAFGILVGATATLTRGFEHWTFEALRRQDAREGHLLAPPVALIADSGRELVPWGPDGRASDIYIVDFIYTSCPTVCQALGSSFAQMQSELHRADAPARSPHLLSISIDPRHDDRAALAGYARRHAADASAWVVASPHTSAGSRRLLGALEVIAVPDGTGGFVHNGDIHVIDGLGRVHGIYDDARWRDAMRDASLLAAQAS